MKKTIFLIFFLIFVSCLTGKSYGTITVNAAPNPVQVGQTVMVTGSTNCQSVNIDFGDGTSSGNIPVIFHMYSRPHTYSLPGIKNIVATGTMCLIPPNAASVALQVVCVPLSFSTPSPLPFGTAGQPYNIQLAATGGQPPVTFGLALFNSLPPGLSLSSTGLISGTPTTPGTYIFTLDAIDSCQVVGKAFSLTIQGSPFSIVSPMALPSALVGQTYTYQLQTSGSQGVVSFSLLTGSLPPGMTLSPTGLISGTPLSAGTYYFTIKATDSFGGGTKSAAQAFSLIVNVAACPPLSITSSPSLASATVGQPYTAQLQASGGQPPIYFIIVSGSLPAGMNLSPTGLISGTPVSPGTYTATVRATDSCGGGPQNADQAISITVNPSCPPLTVVSPPALAAATVGQAYTAQLQSSGGQPPVTFSVISGSLPAGMNLTPTGLISGTPAAAGAYSFTIRATDNCGGGGQNADLTFSITVNPAASPCPALAITSAPSLSSAIIGQPYTTQLQSSGGQQPIVYGIVSGSLPPGLSMNTAGLISGVPSTPGIFSFRVRAVDSCPGQQSFEASFTIEIQSPSNFLTVTPIPASFSLPRGRSSVVSLVYQFTGSQSVNVSLSSPSGNFIVAGENIEVSASPLSVNVISGRARLPETIVIPVSVLERTLQRGLNTFTYERTFAGGGFNLVATVNFTITTEAMADFALRRMELYFENRRGEITVERNYPSLTAYAEIRFVGSGLLQGFWEVDGRVLSYVNQHLTYASSVVLQTPEIPPLPTFDAGTHTVRFIITNPAPDLPVPSIIYFVTPTEYKGGRAALDLRAPKDKSEIGFEPVNFEWERTDNAALYLIQYFEDPASNPVFTAYTRDSSYSLPDMALTGTFSPGGTYYWKVIGFDSEGNITAESPQWSFSFKALATHVPGQIIAATEEAAFSETFVDELKSRHGLKVIEAFPLKSVDLMAIVFDAGTKDIFKIIDEFKKDRRIIFAQPNYIFRTMGDSLRNLQYSSDIMKMDKVHGLYKGRGVKIAVIDTGVDANHDDLKGRVKISKNFVSDEGSPEVHGTAIAGIIAASINGVGIEGIAPEAEVLALRACRQTSSARPEGECRTQNLLKALDEAIVQQAKIVNMSFGIAQYDPLLAKIIDRGNEKGILFVAPVGNSTNEKTLLFPASHPSVISVGGFDEKLNPYPNSRISKQASVCAPAVNVITTVPGNKHNFMSGTSLASAYITGILALSIEKNGKMDRKNLPVYKGDICKWEEKLLGAEFCDK